MLLGIDCDASPPWTGRLTVAGTGVVLLLVMHDVTTAAILRLLMESHNVSGGFGGNNCEDAVRDLQCVIRKALAQDPSQLAVKTGHRFF